MPPTGDPAATHQRRSRHDGLKPRLHCSPAALLQHDTTTPGFRETLMSSAARRTTRQTLACGQLLVANPDVLGTRTTSARNSTPTDRAPRTTRRNSVRQRLQGRAQIGSTTCSASLSAAALRFRQEVQEILQSARVGGHARIEGNGCSTCVAASTSGPTPRHGWTGSSADGKISGVGRIQSGELLDFGNVHWSDDGRRTGGFGRAPLASNGQLFILPMTSFRKPLRPSRHP